MLNDYQITVVRRAMAVAVDKDIEVKRLAKGMQVKESEILQVLALMPQIQCDVPTLQESNKERSGRTWWTTKQLEQLHQLRADGKGPSEIARIMGLKVHQVQSRLHSDKKSRSSVMPSTPMEAESVPVVNDSAVSPPESPPELESVACELKSPSKKEDTSVISKDNPDSFPLSTTTIVKRPFLFAVELTGLMRSLEYSYPPVEMGYLEANQTAGWATCHFKAAGEDYIISLRREEQSHEVAEFNS
ncbi:hypothetical protein [Clostridium merdae]|uniref:hypothetical protein n=1 Tax=Clostridium merdae TaxID=1958780 RepID=UPI000A26F02D|nr:hypothetical protein [Clostridium merdae]